MNGKFILLNICILLSFAFGIVFIHMYSELQNLNDSIREHEKENAERAKQLEKEANIIETINESI